MKMFLVNKMFGEVQRPIFYSLFSEKVMETHVSRARQHQIFNCAREKNRVFTGEVRGAKSLSFLAELPELTRIAVWVSRSSEI